MMYQTEIIRGDDSAPKELGQIKAAIEDLYHTGVDCMQLAGTDTQYAPLRHALEFLAGQEKSITAAHPVPAYAGVERCAFSKAQLQEMLQEYRMVVAALEWVLGKRTDEELCDIPID